MGFTGKNQSLTFGGTAAPCVEGVDWGREANAVVKECAQSTVVITDTGLETHTLTLNLVLSVTDTATLALFAVGATGAIVWQWGQTSSTDVKVTCSEGIVTSSPVSLPSNGKITMTVNIALNAQPVVSTVT